MFWALTLSKACLAIPWAISVEEMVARILKTAIRYEFETWLAHLWDTWWSFLTLKSLYQNYKMISSNTNKKKIAKFEFHCQGDLLVNVSTYITYSNLWNREVIYKFWELSEWITYLCSSVSGVIWVWASC